MVDKTRKIWINSLIFLSKLKILIKKLSYLDLHVLILITLGKC